MTVVDESKEDSNLQNIVAHLQQVLLSDNVLAAHASEPKTQISATTSDDFLDQLAPLVRDTLNSNQTEELRSGLDTITKYKDQEIEDLCNGKQNVSVRGLFLISPLDIANNPQ